MNLSKLIRIRIKYYMKLNKMNMSDLSKASSVNNSTIVSFMSGRCKILRLDNLYYICKAFDITLKEFFSDSRFHTVEQD